MKIDDIVKVQVIAVTGYEMEPDQVVPIGKWAIIGDGKYEQSVLVKDIIGTTIRMRRVASTQYKINVLSSNESWGSVNGSGSYDEGSIVSIAAMANDGYKFIQWQDGNKDNPRNILVDRNMNFIANFEQEQLTYTIRVSITPGQQDLGTVSGGGTGLKIGDIVNISAKPNEYCKFVQWDDGNRDANRSVTVYGDKTYVALFNATRYHISVISNNNTWGTVTGGGTYIEGTTIELKATPKPGYRFVRWNDGNTSAQRSVVVKNTTQYTAYFEVIPSTLAEITCISSDIGMGYTIPAGTNKYNIGDELLIQAIAKPGFEFVRWKELDVKDPNYKINITGNATYTAEFKPTESETRVVTVAVDPSGAGEVTGAGTYRLQDICKLTATANAGYIFKYFDLAGKGVSDNPCSFEVDRDINVVAHFDKVVYNWEVSYDSGDNTFTLTDKATGNKVVLDKYGRWVEDERHVAWWQVSGIELMKDPYIDKDFQLWYRDGKNGIESKPIKKDGYYPNFNENSKLIDTIVHVYDMASGMDGAVFEFTSVPRERQSDVTNNYINGNPGWWKL